MPQSRSIEELLALAAGIALDDDAALDELGREIITAVINDPEMPEELRQRLARRIRDHDDALASRNGSTE